MRISDWSSDVCSSDLEETTAAAAQPAEQDAPPAADYVDLRRARPITGNAAAGQAKSELCSTCHGPQGISIAPTFPNLAGQSADFFYWQMVEFKRNPDSPMSPLLAELSDQDMPDLAAYYSGLAPTPADPAAEPAPVDTTLARRGDQLYMMGAPATGIPPCQGCHGVEIGRAACRERGCQYGWITVVAVSVKKKN